MPSRIIRDGWLESERINELKPEEECFYLRLCLRADDFGRYHANAVLLKSNLFPLRENVRSTDIPRWLAACQKAGLVRCYEADAKPFLEIVKFGQRIKEGSRSKFPAPPDVAGKIPANPGNAGTVPPYSESEAKADSKAEANIAPGSGAPAGGNQPPPAEPPAKPKRERNPLMDAMAGCGGADPLQVVPSAWAGIGKALADIVAVCPDVTPAEIARRAVNYRTHMRDTVLTPHALAKNWALCDRPNQIQHAGARPATAPLPMELNQF